MDIHTKEFAVVLKQARMEHNLTQAQLAEKLDISLSYLKDLERSRNNPSYEVFERTVRFFNLSADTIFYPSRHADYDIYKEIERLLSRCNRHQLKVLLATASALLDYDEQ